MRRISSSQTFFVKRVFPILWFGILLFISGCILSGFVFQRDPQLLLILVVPGGMAVIGYVLMRLLVFDLLDAVYIDGDDIVVQNKGQEDRFPIANIVNVDSTAFTNPERITLTLRKPCLFGREVVFSPTNRMWMFSRHPIAKELIDRAHGLEEGHTSNG